ncbi:MAG: hypothetical protein IJP75_05825 [Bacteroidaceae bacterium]|nr:hypothetical protein [Bacteroidaceae bacterium]
METKKNVLIIMAVLVSGAVISCAGKASSDGFETTIIEQAVLDSATMLVVDSTERCFDRWIQALSPSAETGVFYLTVYADDAPHSARMKLLKVVPQSAIPLESTMP